MLDGEALAALLGLGLVAWSWATARRAGERATHHAAETCRRQGVQLLDGSVALRRVRPRRDPDTGRMHLQRTYQFDYSEDGAERRHGFVIMLGPRLESVGL